MKNGSRCLLRRFKIVSWYGFISSHEERLKMSHETICYRPMKPLYIVTWKTAQDVSWDDFLSSHDSFDYRHINNFRVVSWDGYWSPHEAIRIVSWENVLVRRSCDLLWDGFWWDDYFLLKSTHESIENRLMKSEKFSRCDDDQKKSLLSDRRSLVCSNKCDKL